MRHIWILLLIATFALPACKSNGAAPDEQPQAEEPAEQTEQTEEDMADEERSVTDRMAEEHAGESPTPTEAALGEPAQPVETETVQYFQMGDTQIEGYMARPADAEGDLPAVLLIHEWWGVNENIRAMARQLAGEGYLAFAVDLYDGRSAEDPEQARQLMSAVMKNKKRALANLSAARQHLENEYNVTSIGLVGWCFGGAWSLRGALNMGDNVDAAVIYYGEPITDTSQLADLEAPLMAHFGEKDEGIDVEKAREMESALEELGKEATFYYYADAGHAFANPSGERYEPDAAKTSWQRTLDFFEEHLKS